LIAALGLVIVDMATGDAGIDSSQTYLTICKCNIISTISVSNEVATNQCGKELNLEHIQGNYKMGTPGTQQAETNELNYRACCKKKGQFNVSATKCYKGYF